MPLSYAILEQFQTTHARMVLVNITKPNESYPSGGYDVPADRATLGFAIIHAVVPLGSTDGGLMVQWDHATKRLRFWYPTQQTGATGNRAGVEVSGTVAQNVVAALVIGV